MVFQESETCELKVAVVDDIKKEIIAFANTSGGRLYVGVANDGTVVGVDDADAVILQIANKVRDSIKPDVTMFIHYTIKEEAGKQFVEVDIQRGTNKPYYLAQKGLRPEGVFVRQGTSTVSATDTAIRQMIKDTDGDDFEMIRSLEQELTFDFTNQEFGNRLISFGETQKQTLKLYNRDGIYTNLGYLLSDQCPYTTKVAVFQGSDQSVFKDRREFSGSLLKQLNEIYSCIDFYNPTKATFNKLLRVDSRAFPEEAIREALLNSLVHRDYSISASTLIGIYSDRIEFVSFGGLLPGVELDDIMLGLSACRNPQLANVFYRLKLIEAYGTGIKKIIRAYENSEKKPLIRKSNNAFKIVLPSLLTEKQNSTGSDSEDVRVLQRLVEMGEATRAELETELGLTMSTTTRSLRRLIGEGKVMRIGSGKNTKYKPTK